MFTGSNRRRNALGGLGIPLGGPLSRTASTTGSSSFSVPSLPSASPSLSRQAPRNIVSSPSPYVRALGSGIQRNMGNSGTFGTSGIPMSGYRNMMGQQQQQQGGLGAEGSSGMMKNNIVNMPLDNTNSSLSSNNTLLPPMMNAANNLTSTRNTTTSQLNNNIVNMPNANLRNTAASSSFRRSGTAGGTGVSGSAKLASPGPVTSSGTAYFTGRSGTSGSAIPSNITNSSNSSSGLLKNAGFNAGAGPKNSSNNNSINNSRKNNNVPEFLSGSASSMKSGSTAPMPNIKITNSGGVLNENFDNGPKLKLAEPACQSFVGAKGGFRNEMFRKCFVEYLQKKVKPYVESATSARGNAQKMNALCSARQLSPHQIIMYEIAKLMAKYPTEQLGEHRGMLGWYSTGSGKCLGKGTKVMLFDGHTKAVEDIAVGDRLMGDDSTPREVLSIARGQEAMYEILPTHKAGSHLYAAKERGFTCNESHILVLKYIGHKKITRNKNAACCSYVLDNAIYHKNFSDAETARAFADTVVGDGTVEMSVKEYLGLKPHLKHVLKMITPEFVRFSEEEEEEQPKFDPWVLGAWLGDGTSLQPQFSVHSSETEILQELEARCRVYGCQVLEHRQKAEGKCPMYRVVSIEDKGKRDKNPLLCALKEYGILGKKRVPHSILTGSPKTRLECLAGLLDTDGHLCNNCYEITQKNKGLAEDIVFLGRSLGFHATIRPVNKWCTYKGEKRMGEYWRVHLSGNMHHIPVVTERKKAQPRRQIKNIHHCGFSVIPLGEDDYYGFTIDGNGRFLLGNFTVTHNTLTTLAIIMAFWPSPIDIYMISSKNNRDDNFNSYVAQAPYFFPNEYKAIVESHRNEKPGLADPAVFEYAVRKRVCGLSFVEAYNRLARDPKHFRTNLSRLSPGCGKGKRFHEGSKGAGSVLLIDEVQNLQTGKNDQLQLGCALRALTPYQMRKVRLFAMTATPGNTIAEWLKVLSLVRRADQKPFTTDAGLAPCVETLKEMALMQQREARSGKSGKKSGSVKVFRSGSSSSRTGTGSRRDDAASLTEALRKAEEGNTAALQSIIQYVRENLFGLVSYVDVRSDTSRHACVEEVSRYIPMERYYYLLLLSEMATVRSKNQSSPEVEYQPTNPRLFMRMARSYGNALPQSIWKNLPQKVLEYIQRKGRIFRGHLVSPKFVEVVKAVSTTRGKQYVYVSRTTVNAPKDGKETRSMPHLLAQALTRWKDEKNPKYMRSIDVTSAADVLPKVKNERLKFQVDPKRQNMVVAIKESTGEVRPLGIKPTGRNLVVLTTEGGSMTGPQRDALVEIFNADFNRTGAYIKTVVASDNLYEGLDLAGLRYVHLMDPLPAGVMEAQAMGRGVRFCSHRGLPVENRKVTVVHWFSAAAKGSWQDLASLTNEIKGMKTAAGMEKLKKEYDRISSSGKPSGYDELVYRRARRDPNYLLMSNFEAIMKSAAFDCAVLKFFHPNLNCARATLSRGQLKISAGAGCS